MMKKFLDKAVLFSFIIAAVSFLISVIMSILIGSMLVPDQDSLGNLFMGVSIISITFAILGSIFLFIRKLTR